MRVAPARRAPMIAASPTPPSPTTATLSPGAMRAEYNAVPAPHITAQPNRLASTKPSSGGIFTSDFSDTRAYSANAASPM